MWHVLCYLAFCAPDGVKLSSRVLLSIDVFRYGSEIFFWNVYILSYADLISFLMKLTWAVQLLLKVFFVGLNPCWSSCVTKGCGSWCEMVRFITAKVWALLVLRVTNIREEQSKKGNWGLRHWAYLITSKYFVHLLMVHPEAFPRSVFVQVLLVGKVGEQARKKRKANQKPLSTYLTCY